jgi:hypothetical protein
MSEQSLPVVVKRRPGGGRPVGVKGQTSNQTRENIVQVFEELGGVDAFVRWVKKSRANETLFYTRIYPKLIRSGVSRDSGGVIANAISVRFI